MFLTTGIKENHKLASFSRTFSKWNKKNPPRLLSKWKSKDLVQRFLKHRSNDYVNHTLKLALSVKKLNLPTQTMFDISNTSLYSETWTPSKMRAYPQLTLKNWLFKLQPTSLHQTPPVTLVKEASQLFLLGLLSETRCFFDLSRQWYATPSENIIFNIRRAPSPLNLSQHLFLKFFIQSNEQLPPYLKKKLYFFKKLNELSDRLPSPREELAGYVLSSAVESEKFSVYSTPRHLVGSLSPQRFKYRLIGDPLKLRFVLFRELRLITNAVSLRSRALLLKLFGLTYAVFANKTCGLRPVKTGGIQVNMRTTPSPLGSEYFQGLFDFAAHLDLAPLALKVLKTPRRYLHVEQDSRIRLHPAEFPPFSFLFNTPPLFLCQKTSTVLDSHSTYTATPSAEKRFEDLPSSSLSVFIPNPFSKQFDSRLRLQALKMSKFGNLSYKFKFKANLNPYPSSFLVSIINKSVEYFFNKPTTIHFNFEFYNSLTLKEIVFLTSVTARLKLFAFKFSTIFFLSEFIDVVYLGLKRKNLRVIIAYLQRVLKKLVLWDHKKFLVFFFSLFSEQFFPKTDFLRIVGFKIMIKGKIAVGGNSRKRSMVMKLGNTRASLKSCGLDVTNSLLTTNTGALGLKIWVFYSHKPL